MISLKQQEKYIKSKGWSTWYNPKYWVNPKTVVDEKRQDYTNYGMSLNSAYCFEKLNLPKFLPFPFPILSQQSQALKNKTKIQKLLKTLEKEE
jgi:hypothetical protein